MRDKLPVELENLELPFDRFKKKEVSYGYVNFLYLLSLIITVSSVLAIILLTRK